MITEDYVGFEIAKILKEKGFEQESDYATSWYANQYYKNSCIGEWFEGEHQIINNIDDKCNISYLAEDGIFIPAPTLQMAMKWLREEHNIAIVITPSMFWGRYNVSIYKRDNEYPFGFDGNSLIPSYEEACEAAIKYCLENLI